MANRDNDVRGFGSIGGNAGRWRYNFTCGRRSSARIAAVLIAQANSRRCAGSSPRQRAISPGASPAETHLQMPAPPPMRASSNTQRTAGAPSRATHAKEDAAQCHCAARSRAVGHGLSETNLAQQS